MENSKKTWEVPTVIKHERDAVAILGKTGTPIEATPAGPTAS